MFAQGALVELLHGTSCRRGISKRNERVTPVSCPIVDHKTQLVHGACLEVSAGRNDNHVGGGGLRGSGQVARPVPLYIMQILAMYLFEEGEQLGFGSVVRQFTDENLLIERISLRFSLS